MSENQIGEFLAALRKSKGYTQQEVAEHLGVSNKTVSSWETGASCPDISILPVLAELYDVTCDEIVRGKRISAAETEKNIDAKRDKAINRMLQKQRINLITMCWISGGLTALGIILTLVIGFTAFESLIGFFVGLILLLISVVTSAIVLRRIRFSLGDEWINQSAGKLAASLDRAMLWIVCANVAAFGFILPHVLAPVHTGLTPSLALIGIELLCAAVGLIVAILFGFPIYLHFRKVGLTSALTENSPEQVKVAHSAAVKANALARWRYGHILLIIILPLIVFAAGAITPGAISSNMYYYHEAGTTYFIDSEEKLNRLDGPFIDGDYTLVSEEQPQSQTETGKYAVRYLFADFSEEWIRYYLTEDTAEGTIVTIYKYRYTVKFDSENEIYEFYAYDRYWQGGINDIDASGTKYDGENGTASTDLKVVLYVNSPLYVQYEAQRTAAAKDTLIWCSVGVGIAGILSLAVTIPVYVKKERAFRSRQADSTK